eukprot:CAMPEP_0119128298 /NCGR_PEP_ID=MMETSP1310-20130426/6512_1 /TAXON_ID=464262 /ORGANISM="Genus nov. species nov., Strain RCC2339" /LENGTH=129 /DNA_ID=CAMNT_0007118629 /DNA_START=527 /DNA_END=916 /DNA_ORIENTATION=+
MGCGYVAVATFLNGYARCLFGDLSLFDKMCDFDVSFVFAFTTSIALVCGGFVGLQMFLAARNQTSATMCSTDPADTQYDLGMATNLEQFLGYPPLDLRWLLPHLDLPRGDGARFRTKYTILKPVRLVEL